MSGKLIGLTGRKRAGKDTAAAGLQELGFMPFSFADPMKKMLATLMDYQNASEDDIHEALFGDRKEEVSAFLGGRTGRHAMQTLGTEWGRKLMGDDFWVDICIKAALWAANEGEHVVITDVRFPNEVAAVKAAGGEVWRINRPNRPVGEGEDHPSENQIDTLDVTLDMGNIHVDAEAFQAATKAFAQNRFGIQ